MKNLTVWETKNPKKLKKRIWKKAKPKSSNRKLRSIRSSAYFFTAASKVGRFTARRSLGGPHQCGVRGRSPSPASVEEEEERGVPVSDLDFPMAATAAGALLPSWITVAIEKERRNRNFKVLLAGICICIFFFIFCFSILKEEVTNYCATIHIRSRKKPYNDA